MFEIILENILYVLLDTVQLFCCKISSTTKSIQINLSNNLSMKIMQYCEYRTFRTIRTLARRTAKFSAQIYLLKLI